MTVSPRVAVMSNQVVMLQLLIFLYHFVTVEAVWPRPTTYNHGTTVLWLASDVRLSVRSLTLSGEDFASRWHATQNVLKPSTSNENVSSGSNSQDILQSAFQRIRSSIFSHYYVPEKFHRNDAIWEPDIKEPKNYISEIVIEVQETTEVPEPEIIQPGEAYTLCISESGHAVIEIVSIQGGLYALETLRQLFYGHSSSKDLIYVPNAPISIRDGPVFEHRGLNLDISRNRIYPEDVLRTIEAMAANKLNRLHIHATDSQSWPLDIPSIPELAQKGAYHKSQIWTAADLEKVQAFGQSSGVEVYIEIDVPGHTGSVSHSFPELTLAYKEDWTVYALEPPAGQLKLAHPDVASFLSQVLSDILPRISPFTAYFHLGGDELNTKTYMLEPGLETSDKAVLKPYVQAFFDHIFGILAQHKFSPIVWEETVLDWDLRLPSSTIVQTWREHGSLATIVSKGHRALFGASSHWYLDCGFGSWADPDNSKSTPRARPPFPDWCPPFKNWRLVYSYDPMEGIPEQHHHLVIGGEVHLWGELTDSVTLDGMLWPRVAAAAEVLWSGKRELSEDVTRRLAEVRERLVGRGVNAGMVQMEWCLKNPGQCSM